MVISKITPFEIEKFHVKLRIQREKIDSLDAKIVRLLDQRLSIVKNILVIKKKINLPIFQQAREHKKMAKIHDLSFNKEFVKEIFKKIIMASRKFQEKSLCK